MLVHVGANIRRLRTAAGWSQVALAEAAGISRRTLIGVEAGDANISLRGLNRIATALGVSFSTVIRAQDASFRQAINAVTWKGRTASSRALLLGSAPAREESELWLWTMDVDDRYVAEPDPQGWHELIYVVEGTLRIVLAPQPQVLQVGGFAVIDSAQPYAYENIGDGLLRFVRSVVY